MGNREFRGIHLHFPVHQDIYVNDAVVIDTGAVRGEPGLVRAAHAALYILAYCQDGGRTLAAAVTDHTVKERRAVETAGFRDDQVRKGFVAAENAIKKTQGRHDVGLARAYVAS